MFTLPKFAPGQVIHIYSVVASLVPTDEQPDQKFTTECTIRSLRYVGDYSEEWVGDDDTGHMEYPTEFPKGWEYEMVYADRRDGSPRVYGWYDEAEILKAGYTPAEQPTV